MNESQSRNNSHFKSHANFQQSSVNCYFQVQSRSSKPSNKIALSTNRYQTKDIRIMSTRFQRSRVAALAVHLGQQVSPPFWGWQTRFVLFRIKVGSILHAKAKRANNIRIHTVQQKLQLRHCSHFIDRQTNDNYQSTERDTYLYMIQLDPDSLLYR